ncbi:MAG: amino acid adenylation domain-containing protein, partial [Scytonema sp. RU_4_4]|nr:amino acid adenylation domain-containing protein [Scytonema sp. RU_4_4]
MKPIQEFLSKLAALDVKLWVDGTSLRCNAPQGTLTPEIRTQLSDRKAEIIKFLQDSQLPLIPRSSRYDEPLPLSWAQERLWFLNQLEGSTATYNMPAAVCITGNLDVKALQQALSEIVRRHSILRTSIETVNGTPRQVIHPEAIMNINVVDLQQLLSTERQTLQKQLILEEANTPFSLEIAPLIRCSLLQLSGTEYVLLLTMHHIVSDGWSIGIFIQELSVLYQAFCAGVPSPLPELPLQYADFAVWQRKWLSGEVLETQLNYWLSQLHGAPSLLQLPTDRPRPVVQTYQGRTHSFTLNTDLTQKLQSKSCESGTTLFMTLLAAFATLLYRYSGQSDILIGSPIANRNRSEVESLIGFFVNTLVLRIRFEDDPSFESLLSQVRETTLKAYEHQDVPFEQVVEALQPQRSLAYSPLFQVWVNMLNLEDNQSALPGLFVEPIALEKAASKFDLSLYIAEKTQGIELKLVYNADLFAAERMVAMLQQFHHLLNQIVTAPNNPISVYSFVSPESLPLLPEPRAVLPQPEYKLVTTMFTSWVNSNPEHSAISQGSRSWNYGELSRIAQTLARVLLVHGVKRGDVVAVFGTRSFGLIASTLGVFLSGGVLLTIDPQLPSDRQQLMLKEAKAKCLIYINGQRPENQEIWESLTRICVDADTGKTVNYQECDTFGTPSGDHKIHLPQIAGDNAAYIFFTSGTAGIPKGVLGSHKGMSHFLNWQRQTFGIGANDRVAQLTGLSFDVVLRDIFLPLTSGATLCLPLETDNLEPRKILGYLEREQISVLHTVPSLAESWLVNVPTEVSLRSLRWLFFAGEPLKETLVNRWRQIFPASGEIVNLYGPTETTLAKCYYQVPATPRPGVQPIGLPLPETQALVFTQNHQLCGIGEAGEIVLRTPFRSLGYTNTLQQNLRGFVKNPFRNDEQDLLYYTGDYGRYRLDGSLEILGRRDHQVKIRGIRIEPGEIEAVLNTHPQIQQAVVIATGDIPGNKRLVAYVVSSDESLTIYQIREFLKQKLPEYMIPSAFVTLDTLPLTPNGKIDRKALPKPDGEITREQEYIAPRTPNEEIIANIFTAVLGVQNVGIHDNFFSLGGHSLLATQLISRLRVAFTVEIPIRAVFESPTVTQLDQTITQLRTTDSGLTLPPIQPIEGDTEPLPLSWAQERLWFLNQLEGSSATYNIPAAVRITGALDINALQQALSEIVHRHEVLRTSFPTVNGTPRQVIHPEVTININVVDLQQILGTECETVQKQLVLEEAITPFTLEIAPLIRCSLLQLSATEYVLLLTMHHIVSDGWSMGVFIRELSAVYQAFCVGKPSPLPELPIQYGDFAVWQRQWLSGLVLETQLNYWLCQLHSAPSLLQLPTDRPRPVVQTYQGRTYSFTLNTDLTQKLQSLSGESGTTLFMTLLAAFATLLYRYTGQSDILVGSPIANRNRSEIESLIGFFVNTLVLRTSFETNPSFESLLSQVRETTLKAYEHQDVPFEQVVEALQPQRSLSHSPLFQVMFVLQNAIIGEVELPGVTLTQLAQEGTVAKFDLTLSMSETDQGLIGSWEYNTDLFDAETIERMVGHFQNLLSAIVANPLLPVGKLPLLSETERHQLLVEWNDTECEYPSDKCIHQLFEAQVEKTPDTMAVVFENEQLTYLELNQRANQLAHHLQSLGVKPEVLVGICVKRSIEMVVGLLAILKAGGAYVPLDPTYPQERLSYMLADSQLPILLTQQHLLKQLPVDQTQTICLDEDCQNFAEYSQDNPCQEVKADNLAYVIYTSGSSGKPKGTMILHSGIVNYLSWCTKAYNVATGVGSTVNSSIGFDATITSLFSPLLVGSKVVILPEEGEIEALKTALCSGTKFSLIKITPAHLEILSHLFASEQVNIQTQAFIIGGEALTEKVTSFWQKNAAATRLINEYGPTETVVGCCVYEIGKLCFPGSNIPIGRPIANTQIYILDQHHQPVPIGVPGELYIGGDGLARGYFNRPELTQEKFISNRFSDAKSKQLYKTGDLARYKSDGNIEFLGRIDNQVKIRGFRIELGEIEAVLNTHPHIQQAVVIATEDIIENKSLVAYVVPSGERLTTNQLRELLKQQLPEYMIPSGFVTLDILPLTPNGKIDKKALPKPDGEITRETQYVAPRTPNEEIIANIFTAVLGVQNVGIHDNFFSLGGHSLLATQ